MFKPLEVGWKKTFEKNCKAMAQTDNVTYRLYWPRGCFNGVNVFVFFKSSSHFETSCFLINATQKIFCSKVLSLRMKLSVLFFTNTLCFVLKHYRCMKGNINLVKTRWGSPVDNIPSIDRLHHFVKTIFFKERKNVTCDSWHGTQDLWYIVGGEHSLQISAPYLSLFMIYDILKIWRKRLAHWI